MHAILLSAVRSSVATLTAAVVLGVLAWTDAALAVPVVNETNNFNDTTESAFPAATNDLINQGSPSFSGQTSSGYANEFGSGGLTKLNDGAIGATNDVTATTISSTDYTTTFHLDTSVNTLGYTIGGINTISGWNDNRVYQQYDVYYSTVTSNPLGNDLTGFSLLQHVVDEPTLTGTGQYSTEVSLAITGLTGVNAIQFLVAHKSVAGQDSTYREFDVLGAATTVPEPTSLALFGLASVGLLVALRRNRKA